MHVALTDVLTCPRCGPGHGLILLPEEVADRRVVRGVLGCADCRERYGIREGVADLVVGEAVGATVPAEPKGGDEAAVRLAGLLGLAEGSGVALLVGPASAHAVALSRLVEGVEVVATLSAAAEGMSVALLGGTLPFQTGRLRAVALTGDAAGGLLEEGARVLGAAGRLLLEPAPEDAGARLESAGLRILAAEGATLVAAR